MTRAILISTSVFSLLLTLTSCGKSKDTKTDTKTTVVSSLQTNTRSQLNTTDIQLTPGASRAAPTPLSNENGITVLEETQVNGSAAKAISIVDDLMAEFQLKSKSVSADQQTMNQNLARGILSAKLHRSANGEMSVDLAIVELDNKTHAYSMRAVADGDKMKLSSTSLGGDLEFQGGFLKCLDLDGGCEISYAKIKFSGAYTRIIFRNSYADGQFVIYKNPTAALNTQFELWNLYILNKTGQIQTSEKFDYLQTSSFSVVNGKSNMDLIIAAQDKQSVALSIPFLSVLTDVGTKLSGPVQKTSTPQTSTPQQSLSHALLAAKLVANQGSAQLRLMFSFSQDTSDSKIWLKLTCLEKPTLNIVDLQKFEANISKF